MVRARRVELEEMKIKVRLNPEQGDAWFKSSAKWTSRKSCECDGRDLNPGYQIGNLMS